MGKILSGLGFQSNNEYIELQNKILEIRERTKNIDELTNILNELENNNSFAGLKNDLKEFKEEFIKEIQREKQIKQVQESKILSQLKNIKKNW